MTGSFLREIIMREILEMIMRSYDAKWLCAEMIMHEILVDELVSWPLHTAVTPDASISVALALPRVTSRKINDASDCFVGVCPLAFALLLLLLLQMYLFRLQQARCCEQIMQAVYAPVRWLLHARCCCRCC